MEADRIKAAFQRLVQAFTARIDDLALYPARVVSQDGQTVELHPEDARIPDLADVPLWHGLPGVEVEVENGANVLLGFRGGDPTRPFAMLWQAESLKGLTVTATGEVKVACRDAKVEASGKAEVKGASVKVEATGAVDVKGNMVRLNDDVGLLGVARQSDPVQAGPFGGTITMGSLKVKAG